MNTKSRFTKVAVAAGLVVTSGAAVLGLTGFASARLAPNDAPAVVQSVDTDSASTADGSAATADDGASTGSAAGSTTAAGDVNAAAAEAPAAAPADGAHAPRFATDALAKVLKLSTTELNTQLQSGKTLADIAKAQNVDIADVKAQLLKDFTEKEQAEVASGKHTQAEVDAKIAEFKTRLDDIVNGVRPAGGPGMGGKGGHGPGGRHGHGPMGDDHGAPGTEGAGFSA